MLARHIFLRRPGFPVPFTIQATAPVHLVAQVVGLLVSWRQHVHANPTVITDVVRAVMLKLLNRMLFHLFSRKTGGGNEHVPLVVVFNADVVGSLFVAFCMQYKPSLLIATSVAALKLVTAAMSYRDIHAAASKLAALRDCIHERQKSTRHSCSQFASPPKLSAPRPRLLGEVVDIVGRHGTDIPSSTSSSGANKTNKRAQVNQGLHTASRPSTLAKSVRVLHVKRVAPASNLPEGFDCSDASLDPDCRRSPERTELDAVPKHRCLGPSMSDFSMPTELERLERRYAALVLRFLYVTESMVLVEYVEVVIPVLYCAYQHCTSVAKPGADRISRLFVSRPGLYVTAMSRMPNRVYYAQFANMDAAHLQQTVANVLLYTLVELLSLVALHFSLCRLLRISSLRQLAFVLTRQTAHVQSALVLWVVYATQASLDHYGAPCRE